MFQKNNMNYDLAIIVPCHLQGKYTDRLRDFREYGLLNIQETKIKVFFLSGSCEIPEDLTPDTWPYEVEFVRSERMHDGPKTYDFALNLKIEEVVKYRWWLKVDDDSITDVWNQVRRLDEEYDWQREEFIFGEYGPGTEGIFHEAIRKTKYSDLFFYPNCFNKQSFHHEWESSVISSPCMKKIIEDDECKLLFELLATQANDTKICWSDQGFAAAARFNKVHGSDCVFMSKYPLVDNFSLFGGRFTHIHYMHRECPEWASFIRKFNKYKEDSMNS